MAAEWERQAKTDANKTQAERDKDTAKKITFSEFLDNIFWPRHVLNGEHRQTTIEFYGHMRHRCEEYFGQMKLSEICKSDVEGFIVWLNTQTQENGNPLSPSTKKHQYNFLRIALTYAVDHDLIEHSPIKGTKPPKQPHKDVDFLPVDEAKAFLRALEAAPTRWKAIMQSLIFLGLRRGELCGLQWQDVDLAHGVVAIRRNVTYSARAGVQIGEPKTANSFRTLPLPESLISALREWQKEQHRQYAPTKIEPSTFVFSSEADPYAPQFPTNLTKHVKRFMAAHGLPDASPHDLRHTAASLMLESGANIKAVQNFLGHEDAGTTLRFYTAIDERGLRKAGNLLENALLG